MYYIYDSKTRLPADSYTELLISRFPKKCVFHIFHNFMNQLKERSKF